MLSPAAPLTLQKRRAGPNAPAKAKLFLIHDGSGTVANYTKLQSLDCDVYGMYVLTAFEHRRSRILHTHPTDTTFFFGSQDPRLMTSAEWLGGVAEMATQYAQMISKAAPNSAVILGGLCPIFLSAI